MKFLDTSDRSFHENSSKFEEIIQWLNITIQYSRETEGKTSEEHNQKSVLMIDDLGLNLRDTKPYYHMIIQY